MSIYINELISQNKLFIWIAENVFFSVILSYIDYAFFVYLFKVKTTKKQAILQISANCIFRVLTKTILPVELYRVLNLAFVIFTFRFILKEPIEKCILGESINAVTIMTTETILSKILCRLFDNMDTYLKGLYDLKFNTIFMIFMCLFRFVIYFFVRIKSYTIKLPEILNKKDKKSIMIISGVGCFVIYLNALEITMYLTDFPYLFFLIDIVSLTLYFNISMKDLIRITRIEEQNNIINNLVSYNKTLVIMYDSIAGFRHDLSNFIQALEGCAEAEDIGGVKELTNSILVDFHKVNNLGFLNPSIMNNSAIYSIVVNKFYEAKDLGIDIILNVKTDLSCISNFNYEVCRILGILLDNAIEATKNLDEKYLKLTIINHKKDKKIEMCIKNSYSKNKSLNLDDLFKKGYTTKEENPHEHGIGLYNIKQILKSNDRFNLKTKIYNLFEQDFYINY